MKKLLNIYFAFFKIGAFTFGGGYAMLPIIQEEVVNKKKWATEDEVLDYYAIGQSTPGIIAINTATFIGYNEKGILGAIAATFGLVSPSLIIITIIARFFKNFQDLKVVQAAFGGIQVAVTALIAVTVKDLFKQSVKDRSGVVLFVIAFISVGLFNVSPIILVVLSAIFGILKFKDTEVKEN